LKLRIARLFGLVLLVCALIPSPAALADEGWAEWTIAPEP